MRPKNGLGSEDIEEGRRDARVSQLYRNVGCGQRHRGPGLRSHRREHRVLILPIQGIEGGDSVPRASRRLLPDIQNLVGLRKRQRLQENSIDKAEDCCSSSDPKRRSQNRAGS